jgi:predicted MPP superfamily phosphohydrolase
MVFVLVYFAVLAYPLLRMVGLAFPGWQPGTLGLAAVLAGPACGRLLYEWLPGAIARALSALVMTWLGVSFLAFCLVLPWELLNLVLPLPSRASGFVLLTATAALALSGFANAQRVRVRTIEVAGTAAVRGLTLVQLSDVHVGSRSGRFLARAVQQANRARPDYVLITGDLVDFRHISERVLASLATLQAPAYFVIGNHERYVDCDAICGRLTALGIIVLRNAEVRVGPLQLIGIDDAEPKSQVSRELPRFVPDPEAFRILLYHRPDGVREAAAWGFHLMLCGHTHNGQIVPFNYLVRRVFPRIHGLYREDGMQLYVSPGTGTWGPILRLGSRCEVTAIRLV